MFNNGTSVLRRYNLLGAPLSADSTSETWLARDSGYREYLIRLWPFKGNDPDPIQRALWDHQLRILYRLASSPNADGGLLTMRDAGVDRDIKTFAMVLQGDGYAVLDRLLAKRNQPWLQLRDKSLRRELWLALSRLAQGILLLHKQRVLHRNIGAQSVYLDEHVGPVSMRLGGFEWSIRLGQQSEPFLLAAPTIPGHLLASAHAGFSPETDWFDFGGLAVRLVLNVERIRSLSLSNRPAALFDIIRGSTDKDLNELERSLLEELLCDDPGERPFGETIDDRIVEIADSLGEFSRTKRHSPLLLALDERSNAVRDIAERAAARGFSPDSVDPRAPFSPYNVAHVAAVKDYIRRDLVEAELFAVPNTSYYVLIGDTLTLIIRHFDGGCPVRC